MERDAIWQAFAQTGDPVYYLLYKHLDKGSKPDKREKERSGALPRPED